MSKKICKGCNYFERNSYSKLISIKKEDNFVLDGVACKDIYIVFEGTCNITNKEKDETCNCDLKVKKDLNQQKQLINAGYMSEINMY